MAFTHGHHSETHNYRPACAGTVFGGATTAVVGCAKKLSRSGWHRQRPRRSTFAAILVPFRAQAGRSPVLCDRAATAVGKTIERLKQQFAALVPEWGSDARMLKVVVIIRQSCGLLRAS
jgi:hypothetical protein